MSTKQFPSLDQLDIQLMKELESDARQSYRDLAIKMGVSRPTVTKKVRQLQDSGVIRYLCWANPEALGYKYNVTLAISAQPGMIGEVAKRLTACKPVLQVHLCFGRFNIIAWAIFRKSEDFSDFLLNELGPITGMMQLETMLTIQLLKIAPKYLTDKPELNQLNNSAKELDNMDFELIRELQVDARQSSSQLARKFGVYKSTVLRRIQRLMGDNIIVAYAAIHPFALGYESIAVLGIKCVPDKVREVADAIIPYKQVISASICMGGYNVMSWVAFQKLSDLQHFVAVELGSIPGVRDIEAMIVYNLVKVSTKLPAINNGNGK